MKAGNFELIWREQGPVAQRLYEEMLNRPSGEAFTREFTEKAGSPFPGGERYEDYSERIGELAGHLALYPDRFRYIRETTWVDHQRTLQTRAPSRSS